MGATTLNSGLEYGVAGGTVDSEGAARAVGRRLARRRSHPRFLGQGVQDRLMALAGRDPALRAALFRVVDVAPACSDRVDLAAHLSGFLDAAQPRGFVRAARHAATSPGLRALTGRCVSSGVRQMAGRFIVGETPQEAAAVLRRLWLRGAAASVDLLGEATVTHEEGLAYLVRCEDALDSLAASAADWPSRPLLEHDGLGPIPRVNLSVKVTGLSPLVRPAAPERGRDDAAEPLRRLLRRAKRLRAHLHVDTESMDSREMIAGLLFDVLSEREFQDGPSAGLVVQSYLRDADEILERTLSWSEAARRDVPLTIRLVKGAYWDHETIEAAQCGWESPVWSEKAETDRCFERCTRRLIQARAEGAGVRPAIASHNPRSLAYALVTADRARLGAGDIEFQVLRGLGDQLLESLVREQRRVRTYCPVGDLVAGMAYLVRRLLENTSNDSFLANRATGAALDGLLRQP